MLCAFLFIEKIKGQKFNSQQAGPFFHKIVFVGEEIHKKC